jgi:hypothetical protein
MKKLILVVLLLPVVVFGQTFPVNNLTVAGTATLNGLVTVIGQTAFTLSPTGPTETFGDNSTKLATTAFVQAALSAGANPLLVGTSLYPYIGTPFSTTANTTASSTSITISNSTGITVGMGAYAANIPGCSQAIGAYTQAYVTAISGSNVTLSCPANSTASGEAIQFGQPRWSSTSTLLANDIGTQTLKVGSSAQGNTNTWLNQISTGEDYRLTSAATITSLPGGGNALTVAARSSDATGGETALPLNIFYYADTWANSTYGWAEYVQSNLSAATGNTNEHLQSERSINSLWPQHYEDPYSQNQTNSTIGTRYDCGTGQSVAPFPNNCTAAMEITYNGAVFGSGLVIGASALDTGSNTHNASAIAMPLWNQIIWYSAASTFSAAIASDSAGILSTTVPVGGQIQFNSGSTEGFAIVGSTTYQRPTPFSGVGVPCTSGNEGFAASITDGNTNVFNATVAGGGSNHVAIRCNGSNWVVY